MSKSVTPSRLWSVRVPDDAWRMIESNAVMHSISSAEAMARLVRTGYATEVTPPQPSVDLSVIEQALAEVAERLVEMDKGTLKTYRAIKSLEMEGVLYAGLLGDRKVTLKSK